jgi:hypothetical protein
MIRRLSSRGSGKGQVARHKWLGNKELETFISHCQLSTFNFRLVPAGRLPACALGSPIGNFIPSSVLHPSSSALAGRVT